MKKKAIHLSLMILVPVFMLLMVLSGCSRSDKSLEAASANTIILIPGTWQTASMGYEYYGAIQPEYFVQFTNSEIIYGHMNNGEFIPDHSDRIIHLEEITAGKFKVQAETSNGLHYTYLTCESDHSVLEYYGTWKEEDFSEAYSIGASLGKCS